MGSRQATTALVVAGFPLLFLLDGPIDGLSPVLPGATLLVLLALLLPPALTEVRGRRLRRHEDAAERALRWSVMARRARTAAWVWIVVWFLAVV